jgi:hypothetical protein
MSKPSFFKGVFIAAAFALVGAIIYAGLASVVGGGLSIRLVIILLGGAYIGYLLKGSEDRTGRIAVFAAWIAITAAMSFFSASLALALITQTVLISVVRTLYHHSSALAALLDLGLSSFALSAAVWASAETGSFFLTAWSFFLVQALFVVIPSEFGRVANPKDAAPEQDEFGRASRTAEAAIRRIATERS